MIPWRLWAPTRKMLTFENVKIQKGMVNKAVRMTNCDTANTDRTLDASQRQIDNIRKIQGGDGTEPAAGKAAAGRQAAAWNTRRPAWCSWER